VEKTAGWKHSAFKAGSNCANVLLYKAPAGPVLAVPAICSQHQVAAKGWCSGWAKKG